MPRPLSRLFAALVATGLLGCLTAPAGAAPPTPADTKKAATFGIGPARGNKLSGAPFLNYLSSPRGRLTDRVALVNLATVPATLDVYVADADNAKDGSLIYLPKAAPKQDVAKWITVTTPHNSGKVTVPARGIVVVPIAMTVPANASPGDHAAAVIASLTSKVKGSNGLAVPFEQRVALRTFVRISGPIHPGLVVESLHTSYHGTLNPIGTGSVTVSYTVHNTGNVKLGAQQRVTVSGWFGGTGQAPKLADVPSLLPGNSVAMSLTEPSVLPEVRLSTTIALSPIVPPNDADAVVPVVRVSSSDWAVPWTFLALLAVVLGLGTAWFLRRRRRNRPAGRAAAPAAERDARPVAPAGRP